MASTSSRIELIIALTSQNLQAGAARARAAIASIRQEAERQEKVMDKVGAGLQVFAKGLVAISAVTGAVQVVAGVAVALQNLLPILLLAPAGIAILGATFATVKLGLKGFGDAVKKGGEDLAKLAPNARATAQALRDMAPAAHEVQQAVQNELFRGLSTEVQKLGRTFLPQLKASLASIATPLNGMARGFLQVANSSQSLDEVTAILDDTHTALSGIEPAAGNVLQAFLKLASAGTAKFGGLGTAIARVTARFRDWADAFVDSGRFDAFVQRAIEGFQQLGGIISNVGSIIRSVFTALSGGGADPLGTLFLLTDALREFFATASAQDALKALGEAFRAVSDAVRGVLLEALKQLAPIIRDLAPVVASIATSFGTLLVNALREVGPLIEGFARVLRDNKEIVTIVADALLLLYGRFLLFKGIAAAAAGIRAVVTALGGLRGLGLAGLAVAIGAVAIELDKLNVAAAPNGDTEKSGGLADTLHNIVEAGKQLASGDISGIVAKIKDEVNQANQTWAAGQAPVQQWNQAAVDSVNGFLDVLNGFGEKVNSGITGAITGLSNFGDSVNTIIGNVIQWFIDLPGKVGTALSDFGNSVNTAITNVASTLWQGFLTTVQAQFEPVKAFFSQTPYQMGEQIGAGIGGLISAAINLMTQFGNAINQGITNVLVFFTNLPGQIAVSLAQLGSTIFTTVTTAMTQFGDAVNQGITNVINFFVGMPPQVGNAIAPIPGQVTDTAVQAGTGFLTQVTNFFNNAVVFMAGIPARVGGAIAAVVPTLVNAAIQAGTGFLTSISNKLNEAVAFVASIPGRLVSAIGNLGGLLVGAGRALIDGLLAGIRAGVQAMYDFVSGIAAGIAARKGPLSYDKVVLRPAGLALMSGLLGGIKDGNADVQAFVGTIADQLARSASGSGLIATAGKFTAAIGGPSGGTSADGIATTSTPQPVTIPIYIGDEVVRVVRTEIDTSNRSTKRVVRAGAGVTAG